MNLRLKIKILETVGTQERLSVATGIAESKISRILRGIKEPTEQDRTKIAEALSVDPEEIFNSTGCEDSKRPLSEHERHPGEYE